MAASKPSVDLSAFTTVGRNVKCHIADGVLFLAIDTKQAGMRSASGKSVVVATTNGNIAVPGTESKLGLNFYTPGV